jgi:hypothetical protein
MQFDAPPDYLTDPEKMPVPYVTFEMQAAEVRDAEGKVTHKDEVWVTVMAPGTKDTVVRKAEDWLAGLHQSAAAGRIPRHWPKAYSEAFAAFQKGEELPLHGHPIKVWSALTPAQRKAVLAANVLVVEDLAKANDEMRQRIGMGAESLITMAKRWVEESSGPGATANRLMAAEAENARLKSQLAELADAVKMLQAQVPGASKTSPIELPQAAPRGAVVLKAA